MRYTFIRVKNC